tara:strand:+ start:329 stop:952 length:624 start_codon:yes stop_codon:yes gene_type:complete
VNLKYLITKPWRIPEIAIAKLPYFRFIHETSDYQNRVNFQIWFRQKVLNRGGNRDAYWPVSEYSQVFNPEKISIGVDVNPGLMKGCYIQGRGGIKIGDFTQIAPNVGIISGNHVASDLRKHDDHPVTIGAYCWIGMNSVILPGVTLGDFTVVGAGSVVTKSFPDGFQVIAGNPARQLRRVNPRECIRHDVQHRYVGYYREHKRASRG